MQPFTAQVELRFEVASLQACGPRLHELTTLLREHGVELRSGRVEPAPPERSGDRWVRYTP